MGIKDEDLVNKPLIELKKDRLTEKRVTIYDQAVLTLYQDRAIQQVSDHQASKSEVESPKLLHTSRVLQPGQ